MVGQRLQIIAGLLCLLAAGAEARSSGGYSRPSSGGYSRTPSFGNSYGGGYSRGGGSIFGSSPGDRSFSQDRSGAALGQYRQRQQPQYSPSNSPSYSPAPSYAPNYSQGYGNYAPRQDWYANRGWSAPSPSYYNSGPRSFGVWDGLFLWSLLSNLNRSGSGEWFSTHRDDPGYQQWRAEAERQAQTNAELRQRLDQLDKQLAEKKDAPQDPSALPPDIPPAIATAAPVGRTPGTESHSTGWVLPVVLLGGGGLGFLAYARGRSTPGGGMTPIAQAGTLLTRKLTGASYTPDFFRVGMTVTVDPSPFILAGAALQIPAPSGGQQSVTAVGRTDAGLIRLYLPDQRSMIQLHLGAGGRPDECRLFTTIDEIAPADRDEWGAWLDDKEGMIGWPQFQTKSGKTYDRVWAPGDARTPPRTLTETLQSTGAARTVKHEAMLYAAATEVPDPAQEYVLVQTVEEGAQAHVQIAAGIDINPATLQLA